RELQTAFRRYVRDMNLRGEFAVEVGDVPRKIVERAAWVDLVALSLVRESGPPTETGYGSDFGQILQRSPRPVLAVPEEADSHLDRGLLAYDGSPKADEALYAAAYFARNWALDLAVLSVGPGAAKTLEKARQYLQGRGVTAEYVAADGPILEAILDTAASYERNFLMMGGHGYRPVLQIVVGSTVDKVLQHFHQPIFICR
ncbi:MAG: universal stress protein, partial [Candidatus Promineifilaceae bacterium]|nr:universal stress protein [Candidatus Promineifilaceae bacterium]